MCVSAHLVLWSGACVRVRVHVRVRAKLTLPVLVCTTGGNFTFLPEAVAMHYDRTGSGAQTDPLMLENKILIPVGDPAPFGPGLSRLDQWPAVGEMPPGALLFARQKVAINSRALVDIEICQLFSELHGCRSASQFRSLSTEPTSLRSMQQVSSIPDPRGCMV